jgi:hypothetical protein
MEFILKVATEQGRQYALEQLRLRRENSPVQIVDNQLAWFLQKQFYCIACGAEIPAPGGFQNFSAFPKMPTLCGECAALKELGWLEEEGESMSISTHVVGFRPPDAHYLKMAKVWHTCEEAGVEPPAEVSKYFDHVEPDPAGMEVDIAKAVTEWTDGDMCQGYEIDVTKLPKGVTIIRSYTSY